MVQSAIRVGVDIGGTFTDAALWHSGGIASSKVLTDYAHPEAAILQAIEIAATQASVPLSQITQVIHGTTLVTNALIERRGAKLAFITTEGFRDVIEMRSENRFEQYDLNITLPTPLVAREDRLTVHERMGPGGEVLRALDPKEASQIVEQVRAGGYEAVAIGLMHAYANDSHERMIADALRAAMPDLSVCLSSVVSPQMRELPRFNTVIANAYVRPLVSRYLGRLVDRLAQAGLQAPVFMMHSGGGLMSVADAAEHPVRLLESGPAGGAIYAASLARSHGLGSALSFDMGGTTAKICLIENGTPKTATTFEVARTSRFKKGSGMTVSTPVVEMVEIGAGGGSIASIDAMGRLRVGPRSAGSEPGPACYRRGGTEPTVTDANLALGRLDPETFADGAIPLNTGAARTALTERLGLDLEEAAFGVTEMVDENMANAARVHAVENGRDVERFTMVAFGGGAPLHACRLCEKLGLRELIIPPGAGVGSAIGFLTAPFSYEASRGLYQRLDSLDTALVNALLDALQAEASAFVRSAGGEVETRSRLTAFMRYAGQGWEIPVPLPDRSIGLGDRNALLAAFENAYCGLFGRMIEGLEVEITNWALTVFTPLPPAPKVARRDRGEAVRPARHRKIYDAALRRVVEAAEIHRRDLGPGKMIDGPAVIVEAETSTIVTSAFRAIGQDDASLLLIRKDASL
ncbi:MAG: hydantoinase/oxoprolinase family protein [Pseudomonadota bacterium]